MGRAETWGVSDVVSPGGWLWVQRGVDRLQRYSRRRITQMFPEFQNNN